jgi:hypothetical protein
MTTYFLTLPDQWSSWKFYSFLRFVCIHGENSFGYICFYFILFYFILKLLFWVQIKNIIITE